MSNRGNRSKADEDTNWRKRKPLTDQPTHRWQPKDSISWHPNWDKETQRKPRRPFVNMDTVTHSSKRESQATPIVCAWTQFAQEASSSVPEKATEEPANAWLAYSQSNFSPVSRNHETSQPSESNHRKHNAHRKAVFAPYLSFEELHRRMDRKDVFEGILRLSRNKDDAYVTSEELGADIYIGGKFDRNRAMDGDLVAVELLDVEQVWQKRKERELGKSKTKEVVKEEEEEEVNNDKEEEEEDLEDKEQKPKYCGKVVGLLEKSPNMAYCGTIVKTRFLDDNNNEGESSASQGPLKMAWFKPLDKRLPFFLLRSQDIPSDFLENEEYYKTRLFSAKIRSWKPFNNNPIGAILEELGNTTDFKTQKSAILADNSIDMSEFSEVALQCLPETPWEIPASEYKKRRNLCDARIFSIDPKTAKDLDDAVHITELPDGFFEVGVHIADVTHFVKMGTALDTEARARGTSTYFVDGVIPMLPPLLCEELCSLNPAVDRLAFSVIWKMDTFGRPVDTWFGKTVIRSCAKLAYEDAQKVIDGGELSSDVQIHDRHDPALVSHDIRLLQRMSVHMRKRRYENGSLSLHSVKLQFVLDDNGSPVDVFAFEAKEANQLIEEFMLFANISVANKILQSFPEEALLRRHQDPLEKRLHQFIKLTDVLGLDFDGSSAGSLQESFNKVNNKNVKDVLLILAIRTMQRAKYFCSGKVSIDKYRHYALNESVYTHFTSPIRRYADIVVHRLLSAAITAQDETQVTCPYDRKMVQKIAFSCNAKKDGAKNAQDNDSMVYLSRYLWQREQLDGPIYKKADVIVVSKDTFEVYIPEYGLEKRIYLKDLPVEKFYFDRHTLALDIYWKRGIPVTMRNEEKIYAQERVRPDDYSDSDDDEEEIVDSLTGLTMQDTPTYDPDHVVNANDLIPAVVLDEETCLQRLQMFSTIDVRLQVNMERIPPIINIYPVNPFSGEEEKQL